MAAPDLRLRTPNGTGANSSTQSANGSRASRRGKTKSFLRRKDEGETEVPPAGRQRSLWTRSRKKDVDTGWPSHGSRDNSFSLVRTPNGGKRLSLTGEYSRSTLRSDITYFVPQTLDRERSFYRDNAHAGSGTLDLVMPGFKDLAPRLSLGGAFFISSGSRPTEYYQPMARFTAPLRKQLAWYTEWRWYGFGEPFYPYEAFRGHMLMTGLRVLR